MAKFEINGVELDYDAFDADTAGNLQAAINAIKIAAEESGKLEERDAKGKINILCDAVRVAFDTVFGTGTSDKVCGERNNMLTCAEAYGKLMEEDARQSEAYKNNSAVQSLMVSAANKPRKPVIKDHRKSTKN